MRMIEEEDQLRELQKSIMELEFMLRMLKLEREEHYDSKTHSTDDR